MQNFKNPQLIYVKSTQSNLNNIARYNAQGITLSTWKGADIDEVPLAVNDISIGCYLLKINKMNTDKIFLF